MDRKVPAPVVDERLAQAILEERVEAAIHLIQQSELPEEDASLDKSLISLVELIEQASQLEGHAKVVLIRRLLTQLEASQIETILEFGQRKLAEQPHPPAPSTPVHRKTRLLLKKDYTYQNRGLSEPTQYYVYLRRRKPKLDRYIGTLFYIAQGCTLSYFPDAEGRIVFQPPHNIFQLRDSKNPSIYQIVRLICLEPPPPEYTFTKQQNDTPEIYLRLGYLDPITSQPVAEETYAFPFCMHEGGKLDRYRWDVIPIALSSEQATSSEPMPQTPTDELEKQQASISQLKVEPSPQKLSTFYLSNRCDAMLILERMRLWVAWSEKAKLRSPWKIVQQGEVYHLRKAGFKRNLLSFSLDEASVTLEHTLLVVVKCFRDLGLAVSQAQNQKQYSSAELKLAHTLFVNMSLAQNNPSVVLKKLFGVEFSKTSLYQ